MLGDIQSQEIKLFKKGKVRDVYDLGDSLLIVATDRISCFDVVLPTTIPEKGKILTKLSLFWFDFFKDTVVNHLISTKPADLPQTFHDFADGLVDRFMIVKKCEVIPFECVVRGYISGSGWKEYQNNGKVCGIALPAGFKESQKLPESLFTPATKADSGHDENVSFDFMKNKIDPALAEKAKEISIELYTKAAAFAESKGVIIADTKFEFGLYKGELLLIDEILTPDSSRFWPKEDFAPGRGQASFDKQYVRDYLDSLQWDKNPPGPQLPPEVVRQTQEKYRQVFAMLTGSAFGS
jgi:phosphoribosylaminoimidazole-succinocarboxamide synthase